MKKEFLWANAINLSGIYSLKPVRVFPESGLADWFDAKGNFSVSPAEGPFTEQRGCVNGYVSSSKELVDAWTQGALAMARAVEKFVA